MQVLISVHIIHDCRNMSPVFYLAIIILQDYEIDWNGPAVKEITDHVDVPVMNIPLSEQQMESVC